MNDIDIIAGLIAAVIKCEYCNERPATRSDIDSAGSMNLCCDSCNVGKYPQDLAEAEIVRAAEKRIAEASK